MIEASDACAPEKTLLDSASPKTVGSNPNPVNTFSPHPRKLGWFGTACIAMGGSNQSLFLIGTLLVGQGNIPGQGSVAIILLMVGVIISWAAVPGWIELTLMYPNRVGGIAATCSEAFRPYSEVLANLTGVCYWWGWAPACAISALISAAAIQQWYMPWARVPELATLIVLIFAWVNMRGIHFASMVAIPIAIVSASLALLSGIIPIVTGEVNWVQASTFHITSPFAGMFGNVTSLMAGLYLIGFAAPAFEQAACHVGELKNPVKDQPRSIFAAAVMAGLYFIILPVIWLGVLGPEKLSQDLTQVLGPTFAPLFGAAAKAVVIWFVAFNLFHITLAPLASATRTLSQLADDGLLPRIFSLRAPSDAPAFAIVFTAAAAIIILWMGAPLWLIAAANFTYLISICLTSVAVWLLRKDQPELLRPWRASRGMIGLGLVAASIWGVATILGFEQFGLGTVIAGVIFAYSGSVLYAWRKISDRRLLGLPAFAHSLHLKLTGAMILVLVLDATGYFIAVNSIPAGRIELVTLLSDIFVIVAILTISVGLILPGMIASSAGQISKAAKKLTKGTVADFTRAMLALGKGDIDSAYAQVNIEPIQIHSHDEIGDMALSFNDLQWEIMKAATGLDGARDGLRDARNKLLDANETLEMRVIERTKELEKIQQAVLVTAHKAGMAEVATNVLHNVGNVLNSVNVSASVILQKIEHSKLSGLKKVSAILDEHKDDLGNFLMFDPKGSHLLKFIDALSSCQEGEHSSLTLEVNELIANIEHIKDIISMQQSLSGVSGIMQLTDIKDLLEDALRIDDHFKEAGITLKREYDSIEPMFMDKINVLQILINLIKNAKDSLIESKTIDKTLTLTIRKDSSEKYTIEIMDNGMGISHENLTKIFGHGFTTKKTGHGFGLHACALAAKSMKGSLSVYSDGLGKGARFTLELPLNKSQ